MILIDAAGWSDLLLGVVIGAVKPPQQMVMERRIPTTSFQPPNFANKKYLEDAVKIADEIINVLQADSETCFKISPEFVLTGVIEHLQKMGYKVEKIESTGKLKQQVEDAYIRWCVEKGVPKDLLRDERRFWVFLDWIAANPHLRESLVKTGWTSWDEKWRQEIYQKHEAAAHKQQ